MSHRLLILSRLAEGYRQFIESASCRISLIAMAIEAADGDRPTPFDLAFGDPRMLRHLLPSLTGVLWVQSTWAGVEPLLDPSLRRDYILTNARGVFGRQMSEYVFALSAGARAEDLREADVAGRRPLGSGARRRGCAARRSGCLASARSAPPSRVPRSISACASRATRAPARIAPTSTGTFTATMRLRPVRADLDYLVCVMPNTGRPPRLVDATLLRALPPRAVFVNPGRGCAVDEAALADALQNGRLAGAVLDVFEQEPLPRRSRLLASVERPDHIAYRRAQPPPRHRAALHRQLSVVCSRRAAAAPGRLRARILSVNGPAEAGHYRYDGLADAGDYRYDGPVEAGLYRHNSSER